MRRTLTLCRGGLTAAAALVLLTACGGSSEGSDKSAAASSSEPTSTSAESTAPQADSEFCTKAEALSKTLEAAFNEEASDPASLAQQFQQTADAIRTLDPPAEIAADWEKLAAGLEQFAGAFQDLDLNDPAAASTFAELGTQLQNEFVTSGAKVGTYLSQECGIATDTPESASPTS
jgi:hypothetical protein